MQEFENVLILIQARMGSKRLPGKVLYPFGSSTIIGHLLNKLLHAQFSVSQICVATTNNAIDDILKRYLKTMGIQYFSGSEDNVLSRFQDVSKEFNKKVIVRLTADNPFVDTDFVKCCINFHLASPHRVSSTRNIDANRNINRFLPKGCSVDIFDKEILLMVNHSDCDEFEKEHVIPALLKNNKVNFITKDTIKACGINYKNIISVSIDTKSDYYSACALLKEINK